ncbi:GPR1/FUN34/yaaH family-domain-containing protein [Rhodocollybia butyracea]|uniref:GPR1/FUN34/yaaH family-domain-containing protein n=1 Tax=Rhodocollybia butyracea TaxID=206335 RepID=A0A9P5UCY9_9AGAR|nr:GPR1/FUN34/yaaH family-domain-containing protein [Rhodocollybia butyracea]
MPNQSLIHDAEKGYNIEERLEETQQRAPIIQTSPEQYERFLLASNRQKAHKFGNPAPLGLIAFILVQAPTAFIQMGWGGSSAAANAVLIGPYYLLGGLALIISGVMEWVIGNTFPCVVSITFGGNWLAVGTILDPAHGIASTFPDGASSPQYNKGLMFYFAFWTFLTAVYFVTSLRTNVASAGVFFNITLANGLNATAYGKMSNGDHDVAAALVKAGGAFEFVVVCIVAYSFVAMMLESVDMPLVLPLGDLSAIFRARRKAKLS